MIYDNDIQDQRVSAAEYEHWKMVHPVLGSIVT